MTESLTLLARARRNDSDRRRQRVADALAQLPDVGEEITVSSVAARASSARFSTATMTYEQTSSPAANREREQPITGTRASARSLLADLANLRAANERLRRQNGKLSEKLSEFLGEQIFRDAGIVGPDETRTLRARVAELELQILDLRETLNDRDDELDAARAANRGS